MAGRVPAGELRDDDNDPPGIFSLGRSGTAGLLRLAGWGGGAAVMLALAVVAGNTPGGGDRLALAMRSLQQREPTRLAQNVPPQPDPAQVAQALAAREAALQSDARRLTEAVRNLAADRDRLQMRVATLEHNLDDVTGSLSRQRAASANPAEPPAAAPPAAANPALARLPVDQTPVPAPRPPAPEAAAPVPLAPATTASVSRDVAPPPARAETPASAVTRTEFGIDVGGATTIEALRAQWQSLRSAHAPLMAGLRPVVSIRDVAKKRSVELRLVVGPLSNAGSAAQLCAALNAVGVPTCQPAIFDGQRLALH